MPKNSALKKATPHWCTEKQYAWLLPQLFADIINPWNLGVDSWPIPQLCPSRLPDYSPLAQGASEFAKQ
jgi:hypothetical protein